MARMTAISVDVRETIDAFVGNAQGVQSAHNVRSSRRYKAHFPDLKVSCPSAPFLVTFAKAPIAEATDGTTSSDDNHHRCGADPRSRTLLRGAIDLVTLQ